VEIASEEGFEMDKEITLKEHHGCHMEFKDVEEISKMD